MFWSELKSVSNRRKKKLYFFDSFKLKLQNKTWLCCTIPLLERFNYIFCSSKGQEIKFCTKNSVYMFTCLLCARLPGLSCLWKIRFKFFYGSLPCESILRDENTNLSRAVVPVEPEIYCRLLSWFCYQLQQHDQCQPVL